MINIAATDAQNNFGEMLDNAQREPVTIEKHGRPVAVVISQTEYDQIKLERLRAKLAVGEAQADRGEFSTKTAEDIIKEGTQRKRKRNV